MFHPQFQEREPIHFPQNGSHEQILDILGHSSVIEDQLCDTIDDLLDQGHDAALLGDKLYEILQAAIVRKAINPVEDDPFCIYLRLIKLPKWAIAQIHNHLLTPDDFFAGCVTGVIKRPMYQSN